MKLLVLLFAATPPPRLYFAISSSANYFSFSSRAP
jgi:hypothetical protein